MHTYLNQINEIITLEEFRGNETVHTDNKNVGSWNALNDSNENIAMTNLNTSVSLV